MLAPKSLARLHVVKDEGVFDGAFHLVRTGANRVSP